MKPGSEVGFYYSLVAGCWAIKEGLLTLEQASIHSGCNN